MSTSKALFDALNIGLVFSPYPLSDKDRIIVYEYIVADETIQEYLDRINIVVPEYMRDGLRANGMAIPFDLWNKTKVEANTFITISANAGDPISAVMVIIAVVAVALSLYQAFTRSIGGSNDISKSQGLTSNTAISPTYSISGGSNSSRPFEPMPLVFGKHLIYPDLAITPYTRIEGSNQILYQIFNFGVNELTITDIKIGQTDIDEFNEVSIEVSPFSTGAIKAFPAATLVQEGSVLEPEESVYTVRTSAENATALIVDLELQLIRTDSETGAFIASEMGLIVQFRLVGNTEWEEFATASTNGVTIVGGGEVSIKNTGSKIARRSIYRSVEEGQYEVRLRRIPSEFDTDSSSNRSVNWIQLLSMQPDTANYENRMRMGLRIRATAQLSGIVDSLSAVVSNLIPVWNGTIEVTQQSSNPGHLYIWFLRGAFDSDGRKTFGAGLSDDEIDLDGLREWADWCDDNTLSFNAIIDTPQTIFETLQQISAAGRASPQLSLTKLSVVFDEENRLPIQAFGMASIIKDSFKVTYLSDNIPTEIIVKYIDEDRSYERNEVRQDVFNLEDDGVIANPIDVELFGVTNLLQAGRQANLIAASYVFRRRLIELTIDIENLIATRGDVVLIGHDLTAWSESGRLIAGTTTQITLDKEVTVSSESFITIRDPDINLTTHAVTSGFDNPTNILNISPSLSIAPDNNTTNKPKDYVWLFQDDESPGILAKITDIKTQDNLFATITLVEDSPDYYASENDEYIFVDPFIYNGEVASVRNIKFSEVLISLNGATEVTIAWTTVQADSVDVTVSLNGGDFETFSGIKTNSTDLVTTGGDLIDVVIQVNSSVSLRSSNLVASSSYQVLGLTALPQDVESFSVARNDDTLIFKWETVPDIDLKYYEIRRGGSWKASTLVARVNADILADIDYSAGTFLIKAVDLGLRQSENAVSTSIGASSDTNIIFTRKEEDLEWNGVLVDLVVDQDNQLTLATSSDTAWSTITDVWLDVIDPWIDVSGFVSSGSYTTTSINVGAINVEARVDVLLETSLDIPGYTWLTLDEPWIAYINDTWAGPAQPAEFIVFIATSNDDITFSSFQVFTPGTYNAQFYKFRLDISKPESSDDIPTVQSMVLSIDVKDIIILFNNETVPDTGRTFQFSEKDVDAMNIVPNTQGTLIGGNVGDIFKISAETVSSLFVQVFNEANTEIQGVINLNIHGF